MADLYDYLNWRGDISFSQSAVNEIDSPIFATPAYRDYPNDTSHSLKQLGQQVTEEQKPDKKRREALGFFAEIPRLLQRAGMTNRYASVMVHNFISKLNDAQSLQFAAMVFTVKKDLHVITFRGTDTNLVGWKEDLMMSFMDEIPAQQEAARYVKDLCDRLQGNFIITGHSKGGNLAVYAAVQQEEADRKRIRAIYNHDGPGFQKHVLEDRSYRKMLRRIHTFIPQSSIVGILLEHGGDFTAVQSDQISILQHDPFSWEVEGPHFVPAGELSMGVLAIKDAIRSWLNKVSIKERAEFVKSFCELIEATGANTLEDLSNEKLQSAYSILKAYTHMSKESRLHLKKTVDLFFEESRKSFTESLRESLDHLLPKKRAEEVKQLEQ